MRQSFLADNLIYNRYDLIYDSFFEKTYKYEEYEYVVQIHKDGDTAYLNLWGKEIPAVVFKQLVYDVFEEYYDVKRISIRQSYTKYEFLKETNDIFIRLPETVVDLLQTLNSKHRCTLRRKKRIICGRIGDITKDIAEGEIPSYIVQLYFEWKLATHGRDYRMTADEYLEKYHVTHAFLLRCNQEIVAIVFVCIVEDVVYLENFSYRPEYRNYSVGFIAYELMLEWLIKKKCRTLFLLGGDYEYKRHFNAVETKAYVGDIYRQEVFDCINEYFRRNQVKTIAVYGLGDFYGYFRELQHKLDVKVLYGIDRDAKSICGLKTYTREDELPDADAVVITVDKRNEDIENFLRERFNMVVYYRELFRKMLSAERR